MTQTSGTVGQTNEAKQLAGTGPGPGAGQKPTPLHRLQPFLHQLSANWLLCLLFAVAALLLDLYRLGAPSIWYDEAFSVELARQPLPLLWHIIWGPEPDMELYYLSSTSG